MYGENNQDSSGKMQEKTGKSETYNGVHPTEKLNAQDVVEQSLTP